MQDQFKIKHGTVVQLKQLETKGSDSFFSSENKAKDVLEDDIKKMKRLQQKLYAAGKKAVLIIFQGMDTAGKDSCIRHIFSGVNPQGCMVTSFKQPSNTELAHDFLWRHYPPLPPKGYISIFNRSHYENLLVTRVHPELLLKENLPGLTSGKDADDDFWQQRFKTVNAFEKQLADTGTVILKFFLHISKEEQKNRLLQRIDETNKNWKFEFADLTERNFWPQYEYAYEQVLSNTSTPYAHWYAIPADEKWFSRVAIGRIIVHILEHMDLHFPELAPDKKSWLAEAAQRLNKE